MKECELIRLGYIESDSPRDKFRRFTVRALALMLATIALFLSTANASETAAPVVFHDAPSLPEELLGFSLGLQGDIALVAGGERADGTLSSAVYILPSDAGEWVRAADLEEPLAWSAAAGNASGVIFAGGEMPDGPSRAVRRLRVDGELVAVDPLPDLPVALPRPAAALQGNLLYVHGRPSEGENSLLFALDTGNAEAQWEEVSLPPVDLGQPTVLLSSQDRIFLLGPRGSASYLPRDGWRSELPAPPWWPEAPGAIAFGHAHIFVFGSLRDGEAGMLLYHTFTGAWAETDRVGWRYQTPRAVLQNGRVLIVDAERAAHMEVLPAQADFRLIDYIVVALYLGGMILMGLYFVRCERSTNSYFRAGQRIPWWAAGMSLFATGASAISLMAMPGRAFSIDIQYLGISLYAVMALPIALFLLAPLVRKLAIVTPGDYLERRFGLAARMLAASIFCFTQVGARMGAVMLLPSIAISAITGVPIWICILVMGVVTTIYTYMGGLAAVIWTDTVQGFVMVASVVGCVIMALLWLDASPDEAWGALRQFDRLTLFDLRWDLTRPTAYLLFSTTVLGTLAGIGDQNFVQRVQCTPNMKQTRMAVATQLAVAVPINILLFSLGLVLFLFYRTRPEQLDPTMHTDGIFPYFVVQNLPPGVSGVIIAGLLAATMSTISSSICAVANIGMEDFARRFRPKMTDRAATNLGRLLVAVIGIVGTAASLYLSQAPMPSIWDLAQMVTNLISNGIVGFFALALLTRRAHQWGALAGVACGFAVVLFLQLRTDVSFWAFTAIGTAVAFITGYLFSLIIPAPRRDITGLTVYTMRDARPKNLETTEDESCISATPRSVL